MTDYYVDSSATGANDGSSPADAWTTIATAVTSVTDGDKIWVRRGHSETPTADITISADGSYDTPIQLIIWPRPSRSITSATWTNGSTTVDLVSGVTLSRSAHQARYVDAPDGNTYFISRVIDSDTFIIDREYAGSTVTGTAGAATIQADQHYADRPSAGITAGWDSDADTIPLIDFNSAAYQMIFSNANCWKCIGIEWKNSADAYGAVRISGTEGIEFFNCLLSTTSNVRCFYPQAWCLMKGCTVEGSGTGTAQVGIYASGGIDLEDVAIYNCGDRGFCVYGPTRVKNVNIGVEQTNGDDDIYVGGTNARVVGTDLKLGGANGYVAFTSVLLNPRQIIAIENYGKQLGSHKTFFQEGAYIQKVTAGSGTPVPDQRTGGASDLIEVFPSWRTSFSGELDWAPIVMEHVIAADATTKSYRYYIQSAITATLTSDDIKLVCEYVASRDDDSEYVIETVESDESIATRSGITDWSQYLEVTGIAPAVASNVRLKIIVGIKDTVNSIYIDPKVVIS